MLDYGERWDRFVFDFKSNSGRCVMASSFFVHEKRRYRPDQSGEDIFFMFIVWFLYLLDSSDLMEGFSCRNDTISGCSYDLTEFFGFAVTSRINTWNCSSHLVVGYNIASIVQNA